MAEEVVSLSASGGHLGVTRLLSLASRTDTHLPGLSLAWPQLHFQGGGAEGCEDKKERQG